MILIGKSFDCWRLLLARLKLKWAIDLIGKVGKEGHRNALALVDAFGVLSSHPSRRVAFATLLSMRRAEVGYMSG